MNDNHDRLNKIEMTLSNQAKQIEDLSEMTAQQWKEIERLKRQLDMTKQQMQEMEAAGKSDKSETGLSGIEIAALNKPPHY